MAGRYWYLLENKSDEMTAATEEFERSLGNNPILMVHALGWPRNPSPYVKAKMQELHKQAGDFRRVYQYGMTTSGGLRDQIALVGCAIVSFVFLFVLVAGIQFIWSSRY